MKMTIAEKILAKSSKKKYVKPGEIVTVYVDQYMSNDATTHITIDIIENLKNSKIKYPEKITLFIDHNFPAESVNTANMHKKIRNFAYKNNIRIYEGKGVCHQIMMEKHVKPSQLILGADSHTCTYGALSALGLAVGSTDIAVSMCTGHTWIMVPSTIRFDIHGNFGKYTYARDLILKIIGDIGCDGANGKIMEFGGSARNNLTISDRITICNMATEAGAQSGIFEADETTKKYLSSHNLDSECFYESDKGAKYEKVFKYSLDELEPMIAIPHSVDLVQPVSKLSQIPITQAFIGSCNSGRIEDLRIAAEILSRGRIAKTVKLLISPASNDVYAQALKEGIMNIFSKAGAIILNSNCSVCWGSCQGVLGEEDVLISTGTRNFKGRSGHPNSKIYLASAATVAISALNGYIADPRI